MEQSKMRQLLNDVHSQLNQTEVTEVMTPGSIAELQAAVRRARQHKLTISIAGGRHAMGGQQFARRSLHIDMTSMNKVIDTDPVRGLLHIEAGADWPRIIEATHAMPSKNGVPWGIRQKQTGVDAVTLGGSISANAHGRGLTLPPMGNDIENLTLIKCNGEPVVCSRDENHELFSLVIGGFGLFGVIASATLRLAPRLRVKRVVDIIDLDDAMNAVFRRADEGCLFGDFQFVIDDMDESFLRRGVFACYKPSTDEASSQGATTADLSPETWLKLLKLAHDDKRKAFKLYASHYLETDGNHYWSDTMQLSTYIPTYSNFLDSARASASKNNEKESLVIGEHYVPREKLLDFMKRAREILRSFGTEVIYGTIRAIVKDSVAFLPWAKEDYACIIFNLRTVHSPSGLKKTADTFRALVDAGSSLGGSFFLTYHRYASANQVEIAYPHFRDFLQKKLEYDPTELFSSDWYTHYRDEFANHERDSP